MRKEKAEQQEIARLEELVSKRKKKLTEAELKLAEAKSKKGSS